MARQRVFNQLNKSSQQCCKLHPKFFSKEVVEKGVDQPPKCRVCKKTLEEFLSLIKKDQGSHQEVEQKTVNDVQMKQRMRSNASFPVHGGDHMTANMSDLLRNNIMKSTYFKHLLQECGTFQSVIKEIIENVQNAEPWVLGANGVPSSLFCCLYRIILLRPSEKQVFQLVRPDQILNPNSETEFIPSVNNPFVRVTGFLLIRYLCPPDELWGRL